MIVLALERLVDAVEARFAEEAGAVSLLETANFGGTAALTGTPTDFSEVQILFTVGGTVGVAGIVYKVSTDDGATYGSTVPLGTGTTIVVLGVTCTISGAVVADNVLRWSTTSPVAPVFAFGSREPAKRGEQYKISWVPGDAEDAGEIVQAKQPGRNPRPLHTFNERVSVYLEAHTWETGEAESERAQWRACRLLLNAWVRCVYLAAHGTYKFDRVEVIRAERSTRRAGFAFLVVLTLEEMIPDEAFAAVPANVNASVLTKLGDPVVIQTDGPDIIEPSGDD